ncbi:hypothetical protein JCM33374_g346 [Metschnikowia sp. JCM 33374]|nr:hypothetical protein JCM33374_g346 [Metschnikowia sp. JCM 33374]
MTRNLSSIEALLSVPGPYNEVLDEYNPRSALESLKEARILLIGAGGLGCEIIKNLALTGFRKIDVIDMDTVDVTNLNRQFLFRPKDIGKPKAVVAAAAISNKICDPDVEITPHFCKIQELPPDFYRQFSVVVCGLDDIEARRWINALLVGFVDDELNGLIPMVDGGTEGFRGQTRVILPTLTSCYECTLDLLSAKVTYPVCTIANTPRLPEHCIEWASQLEWPRRFPGRKFDADIAQDVDDMYSISLERAGDFGIDNVTRSLTLGVVKNIIPAIASTNAIIAASCSNEVFKLVTSCNPILDNYMMYSGDDSIFTYTYAHSKKPNCPVCGTEVKRVKAMKWWTVNHLIDVLLTGQEFLLKDPSIATAAKSIYMSSPAHLKEQTAVNLGKKLSGLVAVGEEIVVSDSRLPISMRIVIECFSGEEEEPKDVSSLLGSRE